MSDVAAGLFALAWLIATPVLAVLLFLSWRKRKKVVEEREEIMVALAQIEAERLPLTEVERRAAALDAEILQRRINANNSLETLHSDIEKTRSTYKEKRARLNELLKEVAVYDERLSLAEHGVYEPHFDFTDSARYKEEIKAVREKQKILVKEKAAVQVPGFWTLNGSEAKGRTMVNRQMRLTLRAFNNECEAAIANTRWNNVNAMEKRIRKAAEAIDRANASMTLTISPAYIDLRLEELFLTHEYREKLKEEREDRAEMARAEREEKRLLAEAAAAEKEEAKYQALLDKARREAIGDANNKALREKIGELEAALQAAHAQTERARAMAERTKTGYVYIISNMGSFGEDVVKIGLTRRLNPDDRVRELGDASVPFTFDTHAIIYSDEAPALESALHSEFADRRINTSNLRKEFFRVGLEEVEAAVSRLAPDANFFPDQESQDYKETLARRAELLQVAEAHKASSIEKFPEEI